MNEKEAYEKGLVMFKDHYELEKLQTTLRRHPTYEEASHLIERVLTEEELWSLGTHSPLLEVKVEEDEEGLVYKTYVHAVFELIKLREMMDKSFQLNRRLTAEEERPYIVGISRQEFQYNLHG